MNPKKVTDSQAAETLFDFEDFKHARNQLLAAFRSHPACHLLVGESGAGKTALLRQVQQRINRQTELYYLPANINLTPDACVRTLTRQLDLRPHRTLLDNTQQLMSKFKQNGHHIILVLDDAHFLTDDTLSQLHTITEAQLQPHPIFTLLLVGLPQLHTRLQRPTLYPFRRRITLRLEINGLNRSEILPFLKHLFPQEQVQRFSTQALDILFEQARGLPALLSQYAQLAIDNNTTKDPLDAEHLQQTLDRWDI